MNGAELIRRAEAIGVTFTRLENGDVKISGPISPTLAEFLEDNQLEILDAMDSWQPIDLAAERIRRRHVMPPRKGAPA